MPYQGDIVQLFIVVLIYLYGGILVSTCIFLPCNVILYAQPAIVPDDVPMSWLYVAIDKGFDPMDLAAVAIAGSASPLRYVVR